MASRDESGENASCGYGSGPGLIVVRCRVQFRVSQMVVLSPFQDAASFPSGATAKAWIFPTSGVSMGQSKSTSQTVTDPESPDATRSRDGPIHANDVGDAET